MGQKVNPHGLRVGVIKDWDSHWYAREDKVGDLVVEDYNIRKYLKNKLYAAGVAKIEIERSNGKVKINIHCSRPGVVIGKAGAEIENLRKAGFNDHEILEAAFVAGFFNYTNRWVSTIAPVANPGHFSHNRNFEG